MQQLIEEIQGSILNDAASISSILFKAKALAHTLRNDQFKQWVRNELDGYDPGVPVPDYRIVGTIPFGELSNGFTMYKNMQIPVSKFPASVRKIASEFICREGIRSVDDFSRQPEGVTLGYPSDLILLLNHNLDQIAYDDFRCLELRRFVPSSFFLQIIDTVRSRLQDFILEISDSPWSGKSIAILPSELDRLVEVNILNHAQGGSMSTFDQRGQTVQYQYNAAGNINIDSIDTKLELTQELEKLKAEITKASEAKVIDAELADDATHELNKVITESKKPEPDKTVMLSRVEKAKSLVTNVGALAGVAGALVKIGELIVKVIP